MSNMHLGRREGKGTLIIGNECNRTIKHPGLCAFQMFACRFLPDMRFSKDGTPFTDHPVAASHCLSITIVNGILINQPFDINRIDTKDHF
jgi:hypothetical protein